MGAGFAFLIGLIARPEPLGVYGDWPFVHPEMKAAGGERFFATGGESSRTEQATRRIQTSDIAHRKGGL